jgi:hypothetical protein
MKAVTVDVYAERESAGITRAVSAVATYVGAHGHVLDAEVVDSRDTMQRVKLAVDADSYAVEGVDDWVMHHTEDAYIKSVE